MHTSRMVVMGVSLLAFAPRSAGAQVTDSLVAFHEQYHEECCYLYAYNYRRGRFERLSGLRANFYPENAALSSTKQFLAYDDYAAAPWGGTPTSRNIFLYDRFASSMIALPGLNTGFSEVHPALSGNGRYVALESDRSGSFNVLVFDRSAGSFAPLPGLNSSSYEGQASIGGAAGRFIAFSSNRSGKGDIYLYDRTQSRLVSLPGLNTAGFSEGAPALTGDGRYIAFHSNRKGDWDVFLYDRTTSTLVPVPNLNSKPTAYLPGDDMHPSISGNRIAFQSNRDTFDDAGHFQVYVYDRGMKAVVVSNLGGVNFGEGWAPSLR
jgi:Tol biopolymer transport system component